VLALISSSSTYFSWKRAIVSTIICKFKQNVGRFSFGFRKDKNDYVFRTNLCMSYEFGFMEL